MQELYYKTFVISYIILTFTKAFLCVMKCSNDVRLYQNSITGLIEIISNFTLHKSGTQVDIVIKDSF